MTNEIIDRLFLNGLVTKFQEIKIFCGEELLHSRFGEARNVSSLELDIVYQKKKVGNLIGQVEPNCNFEELARWLAPLMAHPKKLSYLLETLAWVEKAKALAPELCDWIGIYFKASFLLGEQGTDLVLGPFIGESTDHERIPLNRGFCGMALREERVVNVADVTASDTHIACSLSTRSELVIPLKDSTGEFVAELDIDCNKLGAFRPEIEKKFRDFSLSFAKLSVLFSKNYRRQLER